MKVKVDAKADFLEGEAKTLPILGLAELIWNAVDADANVVSVFYKRNILGGIERVTVADDGHGIEHRDAIISFGSLGGSWKKNNRFSQKQRRVLHGQEGKGRFKAFCLGNAIVWSSTYKDNGTAKSFRIVGKRPALNQFDVTDPAKAKTEQLGTVVEISDVRDGVDSLNDSQKVADDLARRLAIYLRKYPTVKIDIEGIVVDPRRVETHSADYRLADITLEDGRSFRVKLNVIEWAVPAERRLYLCDSSGFAKGEVEPRIQAKGWNFTAYVSSDVVPVLEERGAFALEELHPDYKKLLDLARQQMKNHFRRRDAEAAANIVEGWKKDGIYPYGGHPKDLIEQTERQVFDVVAMQLAEAMPDFDESDAKSKKFSMRLLKQAIEKSPEEVQSIFTEVLELPQDKQADLAELLKRTSLASIISAAKLVSGRLDFLRGLELLLFHRVSKEQLLERTQLHKIIEEHTWLWGEEFALSASDQNLNDVLAAHLGKLRKVSDEVSDVLREDGSAGIVDLMLSRVIPQPKAEEREHLVVELKRPNVSINRDIISQAQSYADAVADDPRFKDTATRWVFWVVSNKMTESGRKQAAQANRPRGLCYESESGHIKVWAKTWGEIIQANKARMEFFQQRLQYKVDDQSALDALRKMHSKYLPPVFAEVTPEVTPPDAGATALGSP